MNEFVPPCWHGCAIEVSRSCQQGGTIVTIGWHKPDNCNIVYIEAKNTKSVSYTHLTLPTKA